MYDTTDSCTHFSFDEYQPTRKVIDMHTFTVSKVILVQTYGSKCASVGSLVADATLVWRFSVQVTVKPSHDAVPASSHKNVDAPSIQFESVGY